MTVYKIGLVHLRLALDDKITIKGLCGLRHLKLITCNFYVYIIID